MDKHLIGNVVIIFGLAIASWFYVKKDEPESHTVTYKTGYIVSKRPKYDANGNLHSGCLSGQTLVDIGSIRYTVDNVTITGSTKCYCYSSTCGTDHVIWNVLPND